jgi:hypothetical protein
MVACIMVLGPTSGSGRVRIAIIALLGFLPAGCGPKPLPEWAMRPQVEAGAPARTARLKPVRDPSWRAPRPTAPRSQLTGPATPEAELLPFTPEWQAREDAFDARLRRTMNICRGC